MWRVLEPRWGPARAIRDAQPLLMLGRGDPIGVEPDPRVRPMRAGDTDRYLPAAAAMFTEELGVSPLEGATGPTYRRRVAALIANRRAFGIFDEDGRIAFKADLGAITARTCQVQGVWTRPDLRGRGVGTAGHGGRPAARAAAGADGQPVRQRLQHPRRGACTPSWACARSRCCRPCSCS